nr:hypothetical protein StreXyl84_78120 [Streptomyces sp. Xyl84]
MSAFTSAMAFGPGKPAVCLNPLRRSFRRLIPYCPCRSTPPEKLLGVQSLEEPFDERVSVLQYGTQVFGGDDEEQFHGVVEGQHRGEGKRLGKERLLDALAVQQPDEGEVLHVLR